jgi:hypothetical protein
MATLVEGSLSFIGIVELGVRALGAANCVLHRAVLRVATKRGMAPCAFDAMGE